MKGWRKFFYIVDKGSDLLLMFAAVFIYYALGIGLLISGFFLFSDGLSDPQAFEVTSPAS